MDEIGWLKVVEVKVSAGDTKRWKYAEFSVPALVSAQVHL